VKKWNESQVPVPDSGGTSKWDFDSITVGMFFFGKKHQLNEDLLSDQWGRF
jgi:hypothetical protein